MGYWVTMKLLNMRSDRTRPRTGAAQSGADATEPSRTSHDSHDDSRERAARLRVAIHANQHARTCAPTQGETQKSFCTSHPSLSRCVYTAARHASVGHGPHRHTRWQIASSAHSTTQAGTSASSRRHPQSGAVHASHAWHLHPPQKEAECHDQRPLAMHAEVDALPCVQRSVPCLHPSS